VWICPVTGSLVRPRCCPSVVVPSTHIRCRITAILRARATFARFEPRRLATSIPQRLSFENRVMRPDRGCVAIPAPAFVSIANNRDGQRLVLWRGVHAPLVSCDIAIAADDAQFGLSEINWGILPGGVVTRDVAAVMSYRNALFYILTGRSFDGRKAAELGLVTLSVPSALLREEVVRVANELKAKNPATLRSCKEAFKTSLQMSWEEAQDYLYAKLEQMQFRDKARGRERGLQQFLDDKTYKPGLGGFDRGISK
jgi:Enoyl-CoA hydratase/isomerase